MILSVSTKIINANDYLCFPIPEDERKNYPVSEDFKEKHPDIDYYGVYKTNIGITATYYARTIIDYSASSDYKQDDHIDYIEDNKDDDSIQINDFNKLDELSSLRLVLKNTNSIYFYFYLKFYLFIFILLSFGVFELIFK